MGASENELSFLNAQNECAPPFRTAAAAATQDKQHKIIYSKIERVGRRLAGAFLAV